MDTALHYSRQRRDEKPGLSGLVIPVEAEDTSAQAYGMLIQQIDSLSRDYDISIEQLGLVVNKFDSRRGYIATSSLDKWKTLGTPRSWPSSPTSRNNAKQSASSARYWTTHRTANSPTR